MNDVVERPETAQEIAREKSTYRLFKWSVALKGVFALFEILGGILVFLIPPAVILRLANLLTQGELAEERHDFLATHIQVAAAHLVSSTTFVTFYLLSRGIIKLFLVAALLKNRLWAYPVSLGVLGIFIVYQIFHLNRHFSWIILLITLFDLVVVYFIWKEWEVVEAHQGEVVK